MLVFDLAQPQELIGFVRSFQVELERNEFRLADFLPNNNIDDIEYRITTGQLRMADAAKFRQWDTEAPIAKRQGLSRILGELPPISEKMPVTEEMRLRLRQLQAGNTGESGPIIQAIFDDAATLTRAVTSRIEMARGEVLNTGKIVINENGVQATVDYGRLNTHDVTAGVLWSDNANSNPVIDMRNWVTTYVTDNGFPPALALTSTQVINQLMTNAELRNLATNFSGTPGLVNIDTIQAVFAAFGLPPFVPYDTAVRVDGTLTRILPSNRVILMPPAVWPLGASLFGTTVESMELVGAQQVAAAEAPGLVAVNEKTFDPVVTWTKVAGIALPILANPNYTFAATVL